MAKCGKLSQLGPLVYHEKRDAQKAARTKGVRDLFRCVRVRQIHYRDGQKRWGLFVGGRR